MKRKFKRSKVAFSIVNISCYNGEKHIFKFLFIGVTWPVQQFVKAGVEFYPKNTLGQGKRKMVLLKAFYNAVLLHY